MKFAIILMSLMLLAGPAAFSTERAAETNEVKEQNEKFCLVCGPGEEMEALSIAYKYKGTKYTFCSMDCMKAFRNDPEKFLASAGEHKEGNSHEGHHHK